MAVDLTAAQLAAALRLGDSTDETAEAGRLLAVGTEAVSRHLAGAYDDAPVAIVNEACIRTAAYLYDQANAGRGTAHADALRSSGARGLLLPYRIHRAGSVTGIGVP